MGIAFLLLGLLPLALLPDWSGDNAADDDQRSGDLSDETPETGETFGDMLVDPSAPLAPNIEDDQMDPNAQDPDPEVVLRPVEDGTDDPDFQPAEGEPLDPVDHMDPTNSTIRLDFENVIATGYAEISNFDTENDVLEIIIEQASIEDDLDVLVSPSADGQDALVHVEGQLFAVLTGAPDATIANLQAVIGDISG